MLTLVMEQMQQQAARLFKRVTFKRRKLLSYRGLKHGCCFIIKADKGFHAVYVIALSLARKDIGGCQLLLWFFLTLIL